ncbi:hypothetical protein [Endozoicomonas lisbonensis]|uniref:hypothetical protein n=1 Tax=Endozoicomonas lisbonensis TaxID=3120522 RepID=UPI003396B162
MSTKCSLAYGDDFHLYEEVFDDYHVYLSLEKAEFEASNNEVMVRIPLAIWEHIRQFTNARFDLIDFDDEALLKLTEKEVDERIEDYKINPSSLAGLLTFGKADTPKRSTN